MRFFFNDTATPEIYTLSLHGALPICPRPRGDGARAGSAGRRQARLVRPRRARLRHRAEPGDPPPALPRPVRSEEHTSELQSRQYLVCRLLLVNKTRSVVRPLGLLTQS